MGCARGLRGHALEHAAERAVHRISAGLLALDGGGSAHAKTIGFLVLRRYKVRQHQERRTVALLHGGVVVVVVLMLVVVLDGAPRVLLLLLAHLLLRQGFLEPDERRIPLHIGQALLLEQLVRRHAHRPRRVPFVPRPAHRRRRH